MSRVPSWRLFCLGVAILLSWWSAARADELVIGPTMGGQVPLRLLGAPNKDYVIQMATDLAAGSWSTLTTGASDSAGVYQTSDPLNGSPHVRFYRAALLAPLTTSTATAASVTGSAVSILLGGADPLHPGGALTVVITQLPASGHLEQIDGTPITVVGTAVSDPQNRVRFVPDPGAADPPGGSYATFGYQLRRESNGVLSAPQTVAVSLDPSWVYSSFNDATQRLQLAYSMDGTTWSWTGDNLYTAPAGDGVRDSSIVRLNGVYYVAYTAGNFGAVEYVQICRSTDLVHWTYLCNVDTTYSGTGGYSWAPEWFVDKDGTVYLFLAREVVGGSWRLFWTRPTAADLTTWESIRPVTGDMTARDAIDAHVVRDGEVYYLAYRNLNGTDCIEIAQGSTPTAFTLWKTGDWAGWGHPREGPSLVHLGGARWRIYFAAPDAVYTGGPPMRYSESADGMATWTAPVAANVPQHGTCYALHDTSTPAPRPSADKQRTGLAAPR